MIKILYISYDGMTDPLGQSQVIPYLTGLQKKGYDIHLLSCEKEENYKLNRDKIAEIIENANIKWHSIKYHKKPPVLSTLKDVSSLKKQFRKLHIQYHFDVVHCRSYISALVGLWIKRKYGLKFIFDMRGFWADERVDGKLWNLKNPLFKMIYRYFKKKEQQFLKKADYTISLTSNAKNEIHSWKGFEKTKIEVIPCCADLKHFDSSKYDAAKTEIRTKLGFSDSDYILSYVGSIGTWYMLEEMLSFFKVLQNKDKNARFFFITRDSSSHILDQAKRLEIDTSRIIIKSATRNEVPEFISISDCSIFFIKPVYSKKASSPTKQAEIMAMDIPVICNTNVGDTDFVIKTFGSGILIDEFNDQAYQKAIELLSTTTFTNLRKGAEEFYSLEKGVDLYDQVYRSVLS